MLASLYGIQKHLCCCMQTRTSIQVPGLVAGCLTFAVRPRDRAEQNAGTACAKELIYDTYDVVWCTLAALNGRSMHCGYVGGGVCATMLHGPLQAAISEVQVTSAAGCAASVIVHLPAQVISAAALLQSTSSTLWKLFCPCVN
jgi:hypothetical protein